MTKVEKEGGGDAARPGGRQGIGGRGKGVGGEVTGGERERVRELAGIHYA